MRDYIVLDVFGSQVSLECGSYGHDGPPLRLASLASLLATPWEERGRKICRIAVTYRREGLVFLGVRVRVHPPPPKNAPGVTERQPNYNANGADTNRYQQQHDP